MTDDSKDFDSEDRAFERAMDRLGVDSQEQPDDEDSRPEPVDTDDDVETQASDDIDFEAYLDSLSDEQLEKARKTGRMPAPGNLEESAAESSTSPRDDGPDFEEPPDENLFYEAMEDVDKLDSTSKRVSEEPPPPPEHPDRKLITPQLPKQGEGLTFVDPHQNHIDLLDRFDQYRDEEPVPTLKLRGFQQGEALRKLSEFIEAAADKDHSYARIVPGRGLRSDGEPVLKPAVLKWLESSGLAYIRGYAPELLDNGDYGSIVVEFRED
jgi:DNA-nicking Smr family endonuclease